jgi:hypothetical protein
MLTSGPVLTGRKCCSLSFSTIFYYKANSIWKMIALWVMSSKRNLGGESLYYMWLVFGTRGFW